MEKKGVLLIAHGSRIDNCTDFVNETANLILERKPDCILQTCFLEYCSPSISEGLELLKKRDINSIVVIPLFLSKGIHVVNNIPKILGLNKDEKKTTVTLQTGKTVPLVYAEPIGADPLLAEILIKNMNNAIEK